MRGALSRELAEGAGVGSGPRIGLARDRSGAPAVVRPEGGETAAARFDRFLADEIDARLADNGDAPMTVASLARELGVKKSAIRTALNQDAVARGDAGAGMRTQVVRDGNGTVWVQRPDPFAALPDSAPRPGRGPVRGTPAQQALAEQIDAALSARGDGPVTLASLARELGVRKNQIRDALRADAGDRAAAGTGPRAEVVYDRDGTGRVQRPDRDGTGDGGDAPSSPPGPAPGQQQPDGMPAGSSAGGARPQKNTSGGAGGPPGDPGAGPRPPRGDEAGGGARPQPSAPAGTRKHDGKVRSGDPPHAEIDNTRPLGKGARTAGEPPARPTGAEAPNRGALKAQLAEARKQLAEAEQARDARLERLDAAVRQTADRGYRSELLDARDRMLTDDPAITSARERVREAQHAVSNERALRGGVRKQINQIKEVWSRLDDDAYTALRERALGGQTLTRSEYFALIAEEIRLSLEVRLHDVQLAGAIALDRGASGALGFLTLRGRLRGTVVEMLTGEGKTVTGMLPTLKRAYQHRGGGVHVLTSSTQLAKDAAAAYRPVAERLGLDVGRLRGHGEPAHARQAAYRADVTIGSASDFLFDLLDDGQRAGGARLQRRHDYALVDEADMILLDWGGTPHRLAEALQGRARYAELTWARDVAAGLRADEVRAVAGESVTISAKQAKRIGDRLGHPLSEQQRTDLVNAKRAELLQQNVHYKIADRARVEILDNPNGRALDGQRWSQGLHEAIEAKHRLPIGRPQRTIAQVTVQELLRNYRDLAGMTGTGAEARPLFRSLYRMNVKQVPTNKARRLEERPLEVYASTEAWLNALADGVVARKASPASELMIFRTAAESEVFAAILDERGVAVQVLNALDQRIGFEDAVIAAAGRPHAVTVATNIMGRGTDILLGGGRAYPRAQRAVIEAGGLRVTVASLFESRRATQQAFGRAARQSEPGSAGEVISLDDPILAQHANPAALARLKQDFARQRGRLPEAAVADLVSRAVARATKAQERQLANAVRGRDAELPGITRQTDAAGAARPAASGPVRGLDAAIDDAVGRIRGLERDVATARQELAAAATRFARGARAARVTDACAAVCRVENDLTLALRDYQALTEPNAVDLAAEPVARATAQADRGAATQLGVSDEAVARVDEQIDAGDYARAVATLQEIASGALIIGRFAEHGWGAAEHAAVAAHQAAAALQRVADTKRPPDGFEVREYTGALARLAGLVRTRPAGAAVEAIQKQRGGVEGLLTTLDPAQRVEAIDDPALRAQLERLLGSSAPEQVVNDIHDLAVRGELSAEQLRGLLAVGRDVSPAQAISRFAAQHGLDWSRGTKQRFREALRDLTDEPGSTPGPTRAAAPAGAGFAAGSLEALVLRAMGGQQRRTMAAVMAGLPWWMPQALRDAVAERIKQNGVNGFRYRERTVSRKPVGYVHRTGPTAQQPGPRDAGRGWLRTALVTAATGGLAGGAFALLGWVTPAALAAGAAVAAVVSVAVGTYRYLRESRGPPPVSSTLVGTFVVLTTGLVQIGVGPAVVATAMGGAIIGSAVVRFLPDVVRGVRQRGALVAGLLADAGLAGRGGFPGRVAARVRVMRELRANVEAAGGAVTAARQQVVELRALVSDYEAQLGRAVRESIRWLLNPPDGTVRGPRYRAAVATVLGVPRALVDSMGHDPGIWPDTPAAVGGEADRFQGFRTDAGVVRAKIASLRRALGNAERQLAQAIAAEQAGIAAVPGAREAAVRHALAQLAAIGGGPVSSRAARRVGQVAAAGGGSGGGGTSGAVGVPAEGPSGSAPVAAGTGRPATAPAVRSTTEANPIRGPPSLKGLRRFGAGRALRTALVAQEESRVRLAEADGRLQEALAENRELRARFEEQAGGLRAVVDGSAAAVPAELAAQLAQSNEQLITALETRRRVEADLAAKLARAVRAASAAGMQHTLLTRVTGLAGDTVSMLTGPWRGDPERFPVVDAVNSRLMRWFNRGAEYGLPDGGVVTVGWLREQLGDTGRFVVMVGDDGSFTLVGRNRTAHYDLSDGHFHPAGYDHSRPPRVAGLLEWLRAAGHQGVVTFHFIPQHGKGFAPLGATFYYLVNSVLNVALWAKTPMLQMWGVFSDVRLAYEVRHLAPELRWRAVVGSTGARMDIRGALVYLRLFTLLNPDVAGMIGETTIAKEAVTRMLGPQAIHAVNPVWRGQIDRLVAAAGLLRAAVSDGRLAATDLPDALRAMVTGGAERDPAQLLPVLLGHVDAVRSLLDAAGRGDAARALLPAKELRRLDVYNPHLRELFEAVQEQGHLIVVHNDFGLARILEDFRYGAERPDGRYGMPLLSLLRQYPGAKVILAHMGMGKFTDPTPGYVRMWRRILSDPGLRHVSTDISWNEVARHLRSTREITDAFIDLVRHHSDRIIYGTDSVKPESLAQYFRQIYDLDPVLDRVRNEVGVRAWSNIRHANLERLLAAARRDVQQWAYVQLRSGLWDEVLAEAGPEHRAVIERWMLRYALERDEAALARPDSAVPVVGPGDWRNPADEATAQARNLLRWHNAVTEKVAGAARLITWKLVLASLQASVEDHQRARTRRAAQRLEGRGLDRAHDTAGLGLVDAGGAPFTVDALVAADQAGRALDDSATTRGVLDEVQRTQLAQDAADRSMALQRKRFLIRTAIGAAVVGVVIAVGAPLLQVTATVSYAAFALRGALMLYRTAYSHQMRVMIESFLERGQFDPNTIDVLIAKTRKYAVLSGTGRARLALLDKTTKGYQAEVQRIGEEWDAITRSGTATAAQIQLARDQALTAFSVLLDKVGVYSGTQYQSYPSISADAGFLGRTVNTVLAATYALHFSWHWQQAAAATSTLEFWVNAVYAVTDVLFFLPAIASVVTGFAGKDVAGHHPISRKLVHLLGMPIITVANALLTWQLLLEHEWLSVVPAVVLTYATGYLTKLGVVVELGLGRIAPRKGAWASAWLAGGLVAFGVIGLIPASWPVVVLGLAGGTGLLLGLSKSDTWRARRIRGPPAQRPQRPATRADLNRIRGEAIVHPDGLGVVLVPPGDRLRAFGLELRVGSGEVVLVMHGDRDGFIYPAQEADIRVSGAQVGDLLAQLLPPAPDRTQLTVCACSIGAAPTRRIQELSARAGRTVVVQAGEVLVHRPGRRGARMTASGSWLQVDATGTVQYVPGPQALVAPRTTPGTRRLGPPGVALPIAPRAPPVRAGTGGDLEQRLTAEQWAFVDRLVDLNAHVMRERTGWARAFLAAPRDYVRTGDWTGSIVGKVVEELGRPVLEAQARANGERVLANVWIEMMPEQGRGFGNFDELDFLMVTHDGRLTRYVSAKANLSLFKKGKDRDKLAKLFRDVPDGTDRGALRRYLDDSPYFNRDSSAVAKVVVRWEEGGRQYSASLAQFREMFRIPSTVPIERVPIELLITWDADWYDHRIELTLDQVRDVVAIAVRRHADAAGLLTDDALAMPEPAPVAAPERAQRPATEADLALIESEAIVNPDGAGVVLVPTGEELRGVALELRVGADEIVVVVHADAAGAYYPLGEVDVRLSTEQLAGLLDRLVLSGRGLAAPAADVVLCACAAAADPENLLRGLSMRTGLPVVGPTGTVQVMRPGPHGASVKAKGRWLRVDGLAPVQVVPGPEALIRPFRTEGTRRLGPPGITLPYAPRGPPLRAGTDDQSASSATDGLAPVQPVAAPAAPFAPRTMPAAQRTGPPGVALPIAPRAPPVRAGERTGPFSVGAPPPVHERRAIIDRLIIEKGKFFTKRAAERLAFLADPEGYTVRAPWFGKLIGPVVEEFGAPMMAALGRERGETLLRNVIVYATGPGGAKLGSLIELDYVLVGRDGFVRYVSAKNNPKRFTPESDDKDIAHLFDAMPTTREEGLRTFLGQEREVSDARLDAEGVLVVWTGNERGTALADFRAVWVQGGVGEIAIELLSPQGPGRPRHEIAMTAAEIRQEVIEGVHRRVALLGVEQGPISNKQAKREARRAARAQAREEGRTDGPASSGGMLAVEDLPGPARDAVLAVLRRWAGAMRPLSTAQFPHLARGPPQAEAPVVVLDAEPALVAALERAGLVDPLRSFRAFGWVDPTAAIAAHGVVVMFRHRLAELDALVARGHLAQSWFRRLREYEHRFRIAGHLHPAMDEERAAVAAALLHELHAAERAAMRGGVRPVAVGGWTAGRVAR
ncbi:hypothetical protein GCM10009609_35470 [Pseudonocardia aurantiaca]